MSSVHVIIHVSVRLMRHPHQFYILRTRQPRGGQRRDAVPAHTHHAALHARTVAHTRADAPEHVP